MTNKSVSAGDLAASLGLRDFFPQDEEEVKRAELALSKELEKISIQEREKTLLEIHGVSITSPSEEEIAAKLEEMDQQLSLIQNKPSYDRARQLDRSYVEDKARRLLFLRTEHFDAKEAAATMVLHFQVKQDLFVADNGNDEILVRSVTWNDLEEEDRLCVMMGYWQISPQRDVAGRTIVFAIPSLVHNGKVRAETLCRSTWYLIMSALASDPEMQEKGIILVVLNFGNQVLPSLAARQLYRARSSLPITTVAAHYCYQNAFLHLFMTGIRLLLFLKPSKQIRLQTHFGTFETIIFKLRTFGIPMESCPLKCKKVGDGLDVSVVWHLHWLAAIRALEEEKGQRRSIDHVALLREQVQYDTSTDTSPALSEQQQQQTDENTEKKRASPRTAAIIVPRRFDVLFGKTKDAIQHTGTVRCQHIVRMHYEAYDKADKTTKGQIVNRILSLIHESQGRFLRWERTTDSGYWVEVNTMAARNKISHFFRQMRSDMISAEGRNSSGGTKSASKRPPPCSS